MVIFSPMLRCCSPERACWNVLYHSSSGEREEKWLVIKLEIISWKISGRSYGSSSREGEYSGEEELRRIVEKQRRKSNAKK
jgi:hypothetical protein